MRYSGLNFNRPGFQALLDDIEQRRINLVITKDLSRLGRDYIMSGYYSEIFFPSKDVRYIAIADGFDSMNASNEKGCRNWRTIGQSTLQKIPRFSRNRPFNSGSASNLTLKKQKIHRVGDNPRSVDFYCKLQLSCLRCCPVKRYQM